MKFFATPPIHGSLANQIAHPASLYFNLPEEMSLEEGAMCEPLNVGIYARQRAEISAETNVVILRAGLIGLVSLLAAHAFGAPRIVVVDVDDDYRLSVAKELSANAIFKVSNSQQDVPKEVEQLKKEIGFDIDVTLDYAGFTKTITTALAATHNGGKVCLVGMGHCNMTLPLTPAASREVDVMGIFWYKNTCPLCIKFISSGKIDVKAIDMVVFAVARFIRK